MRIVKQDGLKDTERWIGPLSQLLWTI